MLTSHIAKTYLKPYIRDQHFVQVGPMIAPFIVDLKKEYGAQVIMASQATFMHCTVVFKRFHFQLLSVDSIIQFIAQTSFVCQ